MFRLTAKYAPPPPGLTSPVRWGTEQVLRKLIGRGISDLRTERRTFVPRYANSAQWLAFFRTYFGPTVTDFASLDEAGQQAYAAEMVAMMDHHNQANGGTLKVANGYLEVVATRAM